MEQQPIIIAVVCVLLLCPETSAEEKTMKFSKRDPNLRISGVGKTYPHEVLTEKVDMYYHPSLHFWYDSLLPYMTDDQVTTHHLGIHKAYKNAMQRALWDWREEVHTTYFSVQTECMAVAI